MNTGYHDCKVLESCYHRIEQIIPNLRLIAATVCGVQIFRTFALQCQFYFPMSKIFDVLNCS